MREAIGGTWLLGLVLAFIVFFASFLAVSINYSKVFNVKNNIVNILEMYEGNNCGARKKISSYLKNTSYLVSGNCPTDDGYKYIGYNIEGNKVNSGKAYYCISEDKISNETNLNKQIYRVVVFFKIDLPVVEDLTTLKIRGETNSIYFANNDEYCS